MSLLDFLDNHPASPDDPVVHWEDESISLSGLRAAADRASAALLTAGVRAGQGVVSIVENGASSLALMFGTWQVRGVYIALNSRLTDIELSEAVAALAPAAVVTAGSRPGVVTGGAALLIEEPALNWAGAGDAPGSGRTTYPPDAALVLRTSGTTGAPKSVVLDHGAVAAGIDTVLGSLKAGAGSAGKPPMPNLIPASQALWAGMWNALFGLRQGAQLVLLERFDPKLYANLVRRFQIRSTILAPAMMAMLSEDPEITDLAPLRFVRSVTAPLTPGQARRFHERFGVQVLNCYGQTELGSEVVGWTAADARAHGQDKLGAVGRAHKGIDLRIRDEDLRDLPAGVAGEVWIRSPFATKTDDPEIAARIVDGYLRTGDLGSLDADGFLWLEGRVSDQINRGGMKVIPQEVEDALRTHPAVADAVVAGVPDDRLGEVPFAWLILAEGHTVTWDQLGADLRQRVAAYKIPVAAAFVTEFPRSEIGKVLRRELVSAWTSERHKS